MTELNEIVNIFKKKNINIKSINEIDMNKSNDKIKRKYQKIGKYNDKCLEIVFHNNKNPNSLIMYLKNTVPVYFHDRCMITYHIGGNTKTITFKDKNISEKINNEFTMSTSLESSDILNIFKI